MKALKELLGECVIIVVAALKSNLLKICMKHHFVDVLHQKQNLIEHNQKIRTIIEKMIVFRACLNQFSEIIGKCGH